MKKKFGFFVLLFVLLMATPKHALAEGVSVTPMPTGEWVGDDLELSVQYDGAFSEIDWANSGHYITTNMNEEINIIRLFEAGRYGKIKLENNGEYYVHIKLRLVNGTTKKRTVGPYKIMKLPITNFTIQIRNSANLGILDWTKQPLFLGMTYNGNEISEGIIRQYKVKNVHDEWQIMNSGTTVPLTYEGEHEVQMRLINKAGKISSIQKKSYYLDQTNPQIQSMSLKQTEDGKYNVLVRTTDQHSGIESVKVETPSGVRIMEKSTTNSVYTLDGLSVLPSKVVVKDKAGNELKEPFLEKPTIAFNSYDPNADIHRGNVNATVTGSGVLSYTLGQKKETCGTSCQLTITQNTLLTVYHDDGIKQTSVAIRIQNIDKRALRLLLQGKRNSESQLTFSWNYQLDSGATLTCLEGTQQRAFTIDNSKTKAINDARNVKYECTLAGNFKGERLGSNVVYLYSEASGDTPYDSNYRNEPVLQKVYVEESRVGMSYFINTKQSNVSDKRALIPLDVFR